MTSLFPERAGGEGGAAVRTYWVQLMLLFFACVHCRPFRSRVWSWKNKKLVLCLSAAIHYLELFTWGRALVNVSSIHFGMQTGVIFADLVQASHIVESPWVQHSCHLQKTWFCSRHLGPWSLRIPHFYDVPRALGIRVVLQMSRLVLDTSLSLIFCILISCGSLWVRTHRLTL